MRCQTQWRVSFGGLVGLDYLAVIKVAEIMGIVINDSTLEKIQALEQHVITKTMEDANNGC